MAKVFGIAILLIGMILVTTLIGTLFLYAGWNWGLVPALQLHTLDGGPEGLCLHEIGLGTAFWLSMCLSTIGGFFKTSVSTKD